jgi:hypothetical protein
VPLRANNLFFVMTLLLVTAVTYASPTVTSYDTILSAPECPADTTTTVSCLITPSDVKLTNLGKEFLKPPASFAGLGSNQVNLVKPLPAVPAAIFMVLSGFLCVSFVKDRRVWLAALAALLWAGQAGIQVVPQLALCLIHRNHSQQQFSAELTYPHYLNNSSRLRGDVEGTQYIGLLHHLAGIPDSTMSFLQSHLLFLRNQESRKVTTQLCYRLNPSKNTGSFQPQFAFLSEQYGLNSLLACLASKAEQFIYFSPAFIFENLARGPPILI